MFRRRRRGAHEPGVGQRAGDGQAEDSGLADDQAEDTELAGWEDDSESADWDSSEDEPADVKRDDGEPAGQAAGPGGKQVDLGDPETWSRVQRAAQAGPRRGERESGPWDGAGTFPDTERIDFGSLLVPAREGFDIQVNMAEEQGVWIAIVRGESGLQLQAFAAPKTSGLWDEDRQEIAGEIAKAGGASSEADGPFGIELHARIIPMDPVGPDMPRRTHRRPQAEPARFLGVDGPRWLLRGIISGPAASRPDLARPFEDVFADVVVVRGDHPVPPRDLLEIQLPEQARAALAAQFEQAQQADGGLPNPFERGPEITETR